MEKLEQYLDQVCRTIGGSPEMRAHVRQELREHLLDAVAQHKAAGLSEEAALDKALAEFGKPDEVRSDLEAAHGQRMTWILDKAMQWKEKTMKAKWLWMTLAHVSMVLVILLAVLWLTFANTFLVPKFQKLHADGYIDPAGIEESDVSWMPGFLDNLRYVGGSFATWWLLLAIVSVALFEWRVKSENKPWIRLSALGAVAVGLLVVGIFVAGSLVIPYMLAVPAMGKISRPWAVEQVSTADTHLQGLELAVTRKQANWDEARGEAFAASNAMTRLSNGPALLSLTKGQEPPTLNELRSHLKAALDSLREVQQAIDAKDLGRAEAEGSEGAQGVCPSARSGETAGPVSKVSRSIL